MKIHLSLYRKKYRSKPQKSEIERIQKYNCLKPSKLELSELLELIEQGCTFRPCAVKGSSDTGFISGQLIGIDIDNEIVKSGRKVPLPEESQLKPEEALAISEEKGLRPVFIYTTFGNKPYHSKSRLVFCLDQPVTDTDQWKYLYSKVAAVFGKYPDPACKNPARLFFGTNQKAVYTDLEARIDTNALLADYVPLEKKSAVRRAYNRAERHIAEGCASDIVEAVINRDADAIRTKMHCDKPVFFETRADLFSHLYKEISLAELLNVTEGEAFSCIIPDHEDNNPSASVFRSENGIWLYKCQSAEICPTQGRPLTIKMLIEHIGRFKSEYKAIRFLCDCFNLQLVETEYAREQRQNIDLIIQAVSGTGELSFSALCPTADKNLRFCRPLYITVLCYVRDRIPPDARGEENFSFYMPIKNLVKNSEGVKSADKVCKYLKLFIYHGLIEIVDFESLPEDVQKKLKAKQTNGYNVCQYYSVPSWTHPHLIDIEEQAKKWKAAGYRVNGISYEGFYRAEGEAVANWLYPQRRYKRLSAESDSRHQFLTDILLGIIQEQGYATEKMIFTELNKALKERGYAYSQYYADTQIKKSITEACNTYGLTRRRCNADLKARFGIEGNGYPTIIYSAEGE